MSIVVYGVYGAGVSTVGIDGTTWICVCAGVVTTGGIDGGVDSTGLAGGRHGRARLYCTGVRTEPPSSVAARRAQ